MTEKQRKRAKGKGGGKDAALAQAALVITGRQSSSLSKKRHQIRKRMMEEWKSKHENSESKQTAAKKKGGKKKKLKKKGVGSAKKPGKSAKKKKTTVKKKLKKKQKKPVKSKRKATKKKAKDKGKKTINDEGDPEESAEPVNPQGTPEGSSDHSVDEAQDPASSESTETVDWDDPQSGRWTTSEDESTHRSPNILDQESDDESQSLTSFLSLSTLSSTPVGMKHSSPSVVQPSSKPIIPSKKKLSDDNDDDDGGGPIYVCQNFENLRSVKVTKHMVKVEWDNLPLKTLTNPRLKMVTMDTVIFEWRVRGSDQIKRSPLMTTSHNQRYRFTMEGLKSGTEYLIRGRSYSRKYQCWSAGFTDAISVRTDFNETQLSYLSGLIDAKEMSIVLSWISRWYRSNARFEPLYSTEKHEYSAKEFHRRCDGVGPTLVVCEIEENGYVIGGFTGIPWSGGKKMIPHDRIPILKNGYDHSGGNGHRKRKKKKKKKSGHDDSSESDSHDTLSSLPSSSEMIDQVPSQWKSFKSAKTNHTVFYRDDRTFLFSLRQPISERRRKRQLEKEQIMSDESVLGKPTLIPLRNPDGYLRAVCHDQFMGPIFGAFDLCISGERKKPSFSKLGSSFGTNHMIQLVGGNHFFHVNRYEVFRIGVGKRNSEMRAQQRSDRMPPPPITQEYDDWEESGDPSEEFTGQSSSVESSSWSGF